MRVHCSVTLCQERPTKAFVPGGQRHQWPSCLLSKALVGRGHPAGEPVRPLCPHSTLCLWSLGVGVSGSLWTPGQSLGLSGSGVLWMSLDTWGQSGGLWMSVVTRGGGMGVSGCLATGLGVSGCFWSLGVGPGISGCHWTQ